MAKQTYTTGQVLTAAQMTTLQANDYNWTVNAKTASYVLVASDAGTRITMSNAGATTITVNAALFTAGDTLYITNIGAGACTITPGTATVSTAGSLTLNQWDSGTLYFSSASAAVWNGANPGDITGVTAGVGISGGGTSGTVTVTNSMATTITTAGDVIYGTGSGAFTRLGIGTAGQVLKVNSGATAPEWGAAGGSLTGCVAFTQNVSTSFTQGTSQIINYGSEMFDTDGYHSTSTNTSRITIPTGKGGKYQIGGSFRLGGGTAGNYAIINIYKNGAAINGSGFDNGSMTRLSPNGNTFAMSAVGIFEFAAGDYVELAFQADTATGTYGFYSQFSAIYLGA